VPPPSGCRPEGSSSRGRPSSSTSRPRACGLVAFALLWALPANLPAKNATPAQHPAIVLDGEGLRGPLRVQAEHLSYKPKSGRLELEGKVEVRSRNLRLKVGKLLVLLDAEGAPIRLEGTSGVSLGVKGLTGSAEAIEVSLAEGRVELLGKAKLRLEKPPLELDGSRITLDLETGALAVHAASARLSGGAGRSEAKPPRPEGSGSAGGGTGGKGKPSRETGGAGSGEAARRSE
jgi:lipopolysaccharide export system protein LptA